MKSQKNRIKNKKAKVAKTQSSVPGPSAQELATLMAIINQGQLEQAVPLAQSLAMRFPMQIVGWKVLGHVLNELGKNEEALLAMKMLVIIAPDNAEAHSSLGLQLRHLGQLSEAEESCKLALQIDPKFAEAHNNLGLALFDMKRLVEAEASFLMAIKYNPNHAYAYNSLGVISSNLGRPNNDYFKKSLAISPDKADVFSNWLYFSAMNASLEATALFNEHLRYAEQFEAPLQKYWQPHIQNKNPQRCLQIGFVSADLCDHALASYMEPLLIHLSRVSSLSLHAYYNHSVFDKSSQRLQVYFSSWTSIVDLSNAAIADKIRADGIDILIDLSGHTAKNRLLTFARKPAPIQVSWMGYPGTTGLQAMDYYLTDPFMLPKAEHREQFAEKIAYLPCSAPFMPYSTAPDVNELPVLSNGYITFGSFNRLNKLSFEVISLWAKLLLALPDSRLILAAMPESGYDNVITWFAEHGVFQDRLSFYSRSSMVEYLALHHQVDICLDTFPYNGGTTTCHALWMGVPTLTIMGKTQPGRAGAGLLRTVGIDEFIVRNMEDFVSQGLSLAQDINALVKVRSELRTRFKQSPRGQPELIANGLEQLFRLMWQRWCEDLAPIDLDMSHPHSAPTLS